jgi:calcium-dependent protein kinase
MELCKGRDSFNQIVVMEKCEEKKVVSLIAKVLLAIAHCHSRGITHRDLKPENILFENNEPDAEIKIIDFGLSRKYAKDEKMHSVLGTPYYVAPEVLKGNYDEKCDIWSIGAMTYLLLCGLPPFNGTSDKEIFDNILNSNVKFNLPIFNNVSNNAKSFVKLCLEKNPSKRPSAIRALDHPWFTNVLNESHKVQNLRADILLNIKNFKIKQKFKQMIMKYLLNTMDEEELKIYKSAFFAIDFFHNGCVEQPELKKAFEIKDIPITDEEISHLYKILDQNLKGAFDYTEFLMAGVNQKKLFTTEKLQKAFNYFDINKSGFIENSDLYDSLLRSGRECINTNDVNSFIYEVLKNIDDKRGIDKNSEVFTKVSYDDFLKIFQNDQTNNFSPYESSNISNEINI